MHFSIRKIIIAAGILVMAGCDKISIQNTGPIIPVANSFGTKGSIVTTDGLQSKGVFHILAYNDAEYTDNETGGKTSAGLYFDADAKYSSSAWSIEGSPKWLNGVNLSFWMYAPKTANGTRTITAPGVGASSMSFTFTTASDISQQDDLLFAYNSEKRTYDGGGSYDTANCSGTGTGDKFNITFYHALSCIRFSVSPDDGTFDATNYGIRKITLKNVNSYGECSFSTSNAFTWTAQSTPADFAKTLSSDATGLSVKTQPTNWSFKEIDSKAHDLFIMDDSFFVVPQTFDASSTAEIELVIGDGTDAGYTRTVSLAGTTAWEAGKYYTYKIGFTGAGVLKFTVDVSDFKKESTEVGFTFE